VATDKERMEELERELAELKGRVADQEKPLTLKEIRGLSREEVEREWDRVKRGIARADREGDEKVGPGERIARGYRENDRRAEEAGAKTPNEQRAARNASGS
jgi:hypothetical protein